MKQMKFPENNPNLVIIPSNIKGTGFLRTCYDELILKGVMGENEFLSVIDVASKEVAKVYSKKRLADTAGVDKVKVILLSIALALAMSFLILIYLAIHYDNT